MSDYRRPHTPGAMWFCTVTLAQRCGNRMLVERYAELRAAMRLVKQRHPFRVDGMVVLPEHLHVLWTLPSGDADLGLRWSLIKASFSRQIPGDEDRQASRIVRGERGIWQRRFWEHQIRDERDHFAHLDYIHYNPVKHGLVSRVADWPHSTFHRYVRLGWYSPDWGIEPPVGLRGSE